MSRCPHLTSVCNARDARESASCPGVSPLYFREIAAKHPIESDQNPLLPLLVLENPKEWSDLAAGIRYAAARDRWVQTLFGLDATKLRAFTLESIEHVWWIRKKASNDKALLLMAALRKLLVTPPSFKIIDEFNAAKREVFNYLRSTGKCTPAGMVIRALYKASHTTALDYREGLALCLDAANKAHQRKHGMIGASELTIKEIEWQRARWKEVSSE